MRSRRVSVIKCGLMTVIFHARVCMCPPRGVHFYKNEAKLASPLRVRIYSSYIMQRARVPSFAVKFIYECISNFIPLVYQLVVFIRKL